MVAETRMSKMERRPADKRKIHTSSGGRSLMDRYVKDMGRDDQCCVLSSRLGGSRDWDADGGDEGEAWRKSKFFIGVLIVGSAYWMSR